MNAWESTCRMCGGKLFWETLTQSWHHQSTNSVWCDNKASVATPVSSAE